MSKATKNEAASPVSVQHSLTPLVARRTTLDPSLKTYTGSPARVSLPYRMVRPDPDFVEDDASKMPRPVTSHPPVSNSGIPMSPLRSTFAPPQITHEDVPTPYNHLATSSDQVRVGTETRRSRTL